MQQQNIPIGTLVDMYKRGELRLPEIQGHCVWRTASVRDLLDSLYRGYPSGSILMSGGRLAVRSTPPPQRAPRRLAPNHHRRFVCERSRQRQGAIPYRMSHELVWLPKCR